MGDAVVLVNSETALVWVPVGPQSQLGEESAVHLDLAGHPICLARSRGRIYALLDVCSHGQVALSEGEIDDGYVECWLHGSRFDLATGRPAGPPRHNPFRFTPSASSTALSR
ncbi:non-heme iron oxygenase ferredoxin subunit [Phycicoccus sp. HDW14]|uniref:non-heme iron oxygenase ferredoxin subunit n=1 Tax=Phycicoccus sp. HDW14 TaxID=2714941 RepID=UPI001F0F283C|nr:non-heme iron oxygenase ferredoxin subunit [Phycicoccus sp. HDW14]